ncbi:MAG: porin [Pseudomonadota bacterium]
MKPLAYLAALAAVSTSAFAQSNVTLYGLIDTGIRIDKTNAGTGLSVGGGMGSGSRWGLRGSEELGSGLKAVFTLEGGFGADTGFSGQGGRLFGRQSYVGLSSGAGTLTFGRQYTPVFWATLAMDPLQYGTVGNINNVFPRVVIRNDNAVAYTSPNWGGLEVRLLYAPGETNVAGVDKNAGNNFGGSIQYAVGGLTVNYAHQQIRGTTNVGATPKEKHNTVGASYNFGFVKAYANYGTFKNDAATNKVDFGNYYLALESKVGQTSTVMASFGRIDDKAASDRDGRLLSLAYVYQLSRRTDLHFAVARMTNNANAQYLITDSTSTGLQSSTTVPLGFDPTAVGIGIRHRF